MRFSFKAEPVDAPKLHSLAVPINEAAALCAIASGEHGCQCE